MTDLNRGLSEVPGLIAERKRYEAWLAALEERREATPGHVFERVQTDYRARLQRVAEELASHRQAIEEELKNVGSRLSLLEAEEQMRRDERAELELRSHVGELEGEEALAAFGAVDEAIAHLVDEKGGLQARINELESLLEPADATAAAKNLADSTATPEGEAHAGEGAVASESTTAAQQADAARDATEVTVHSAAVAGDATESHSAAETAAPPAAGDPGASGGEPPDGAAEVAVVSDTPVSPEPQHEVATVAREAGPSGSNGEVPPPGAARRPLDGLHTPSGSFDELKFLDTVVGKAPSRDPRGVPPLGANVPGNTPIVLRPSVAMDQSKTLKCSECGASNYPTEWYCERCGAELAAL